MRMLSERDGRGYLVRLMAQHAEVAYVRFGVTGLEATIEFPSEWDEHRHGWIRIGLGIVKIAAAFPWKRIAPDHGQCAGPRFGFQFFSDLLWISYGQDTGRRGDPHIAIYMPWSWKHIEHKILTEPETHPYKYVRRSGEVQERTATIQVETRLWRRWWLPHSKFRKTIDVQFNDEVGERTGSWKGGVMGCGYDMLPDESPLQTLRRMERERKFT